MKKDKKEKEEEEEEEKEGNKKTNLIQTVTITLSDGTIGVFAGPAVCFKEDEKKFVEDILFGAPQEMPSNCKFATLEDE